MKVYDAQSLRNVALVGHSGAGKTQLLSALLFAAGAVNRFGRVDDGTTVTDFDEEEIARKHTLSASLAYVEWNRNKINFIDTSGMANFLSDARASLRVADAALVVVDAVSGVQVSTEKVWSMAAEMQTPRLVVLSRLDRERSNLGRALDSLRGVFGRTVIPIQLPIGEEKDFRGVVDLVAMKAWTFASDGSGKATEGAIPGELEGAAQAGREALIEMVAEADDALMEKFFETGTLTQDELVAGLKRAVATSRVFPLVCTAGASNIGMQPLLDAILAYAPTPAERPFAATAKASEDVIPVAASDQAQAAVFVWKTIADPFAGRITMFRVISGVVKADSTVQNLSRDAAERFGHLTLLQGKTPTNIAEVHAGDLAAVAKLKDTLTSDLLGDKSIPFRVAAIKFPEPVISYAIEPKSRGDEEKISTALHRLQEEDPSISYNRDAQTKQLLLAGQGQSHIEVTVAKLKRRFGVEVNLKIPRIPYRETITASTEAHGRHKKQTGGHGQFGDCKVRFDPTSARQRFRVRRRHLRRLDSAAVRASGRERPAGRAPARLPRRLPDGRLPGHGLRRVVPRRRLERTVVQDGGVAGLQGWNVTSAADAARAGDGRRGLCAQRLRRRSDGGSQQPARPHRRHGQPRRVDDHPRQGADGRDADLRTAPHVSNRRTRVVPHGDVALRRGAVAPARQDHQRREGGPGRGGNSEC